MKRDFEVEAMVEVDTNYNLRPPSAILIQMSCKLSIQSSSIQAVGQHVISQKSLKWYDSSHYMAHRMSFNVSFNAVSFLLFLIYFFSCRLFTSHQTMPYSTFHTLCLAIGVSCNYLRKISKLPY